jgi:hypothetical protein
MAAMADNFHENTHEARIIREIRNMSRRRFPSEPIDSKTKAEMELIQEHSDKYILAPQDDATGLIRFIPIVFCERITNDILFASEKPNGFQRNSIRKHALTEINEKRMFTMEEVMDWKAQLETKKELEKIGKLAEKLMVFCEKNGNSEYTSYDAFEDAYNVTKKNGIPLSNQLQNVLIVKGLSYYGKMYPDNSMSENMKLVEKKIGKLLSIRF